MMQEITAVRRAHAPAGDGLASLAQVLDPVYADELLQPLLAPVAQSGVRPCVHQVTLISHKLDRRATVAFEVTGLAEGRQRVLGKMYANRNRADQTYGVLARLWGQVFAGLPDLGVPRPLGNLASPPMIVYLPSEGSTLDEVVAGDTAPAALCLVGAWLATLHRSPLQLSRKFDWESELRHTYIFADVIAKDHPSLRPLLSALVAYLNQMAVRLPFVCDVPVHKDFHYRHVFVSNCLQVIDFDEMRLGDPNLDLAHFCAYLDLLGWVEQRPPGSAAGQQKAFLASYGDCTGWSVDERFTYFYAYTCLKIARQLCVGSGPHPVTAPDLPYTLRQVLNAGLAGPSIRPSGAASEGVL